ncbi:MAG TPA: hypothetical protein VLR26_06685 [Frankiaceae bacterium]|nr:hypothetical protein [Frankiaceae bacterium]
MTDTIAVTVQPAADEDLTRPGRWCVAAGLVGLAQGAAVLAWPHQVDDSRFSFPFTASWHVLAQATFFLQHLPLVAAVGAVAAVAAVRREKLAHRALVVAAVGLGLLALMELVAMSAATISKDSSLGTAISSLYGIPVLMIGASLLVAGVVLLRRHTLGLRLPWTLVALGGFVFVGLVPALSTDSFVAGRLAIMVWMMLFALFGRVIQRLAR